MNTKASIIVMSHLSDAQATLGMEGYKLNAAEHINFAKYIISKLNGDLSKEIDADAMWSDYFKLYNKEIDIQLEEIPSGEVRNFVTDEMYKEIENYVMNREKLGAVKYLRDTAKRFGKEISLKSCKDYVDTVWGSMS